MSKVPEKKSILAHLNLRGNWMAWVANGLVECGHRIESLLNDKAVRDADVIQMLGCGKTAATVCDLYTRRKYHEGGSLPEIQLGTPAVVTDELQLGDKGVFREMSKLHSLSPSCGGWHTVTEDDFISNELYVAVRDQAAESHIERILKRHPAWSAISFLFDMDVKACAAMLGLILDPRWHIDLHHPDRGSRLKSFLGLFERNLRSVLEGNVDTTAKHSLQTVLQACGLMTAKPQFNRLLPQNYFWRIALNHEDIIGGKLLACSRYISFVREVWLANVSALPFDELFMPEYFFKDRETAEAFRQHVSDKCGSASKD